MKTAAVIGASSDRSKYGNKAVRALKQQGYTVWPVNPTEAEVEGLPAFRSILDVPGQPDMTTVYVRPSILLTLLPEIATKGCKELWLNPGTESEEVLNLAAQLGLHVIQACTILGVGVSPGTLASR